MPPDYLSEAVKLTARDIDSERMVIVVVEEPLRRTEADHEPGAVVGFRRGDVVARKEAGRHELVEVRSKAVADLRLVTDDREAAEPFNADILVSPLEEQA